MTEITEDMPATEAEKKFTLKVLFGHMFGCELHLPADDYFLIINPGIALLETSTSPLSGANHAATYTHHTLYLPCDTPSPNIILRLSRSVEDDITGGSFDIEIQGEDKSYSALLTANQIFVHEHIRFAVKHSEDQWLDNIKNYKLPTASSSEIIQPEGRGKFHAKKIFTLAIGSMIFASLFLTATAVWFNKAQNDRQVVTLSDALSGAPTPLEIVRGREDNLIYVLSTEYLAMKWAQAALFKLHEKNTVVPVLLSQQRKEVISRLTKAGYPVLQIDYSVPQYPIIALYKKLAPQEEDNLKYFALNNIPFAMDVKTLVKTKPQLLQEARQGLDRLHIHYRQINTTAGYALIVRDALSDNILTSIQNFTHEFTHKWGNNVINFSINLNENWLQDKSYLDASNGYLFLNPRHWYFPLNKGD